MVRTGTNFAYFKLLSLQFPGCADENDVSISQEVRCADRNLKQVLSEHKAESLLLSQIAI
jgi:hypothetical protein